MSPTPTWRLAPIRSVIVAGVALASGLAATPASSEDGFNPFDEAQPSQSPPRKAQEPAPADDRPLLAPMDGEPPAAGRYAPPINAGPRDAGIVGDEPPAGGIDEKGRSVERTELAPVMAEDGSGLPYELWRGLSLADVEGHIAALEIPPRSAALHELWRRLITSAVSAPTGGAGDVQFAALRVEALDRSGLIDEAAEVLAKSPASTSDPLLVTLLARSEIGLGNRDRGCELARGIAQQNAQMPQGIKGEAVLISGYCAALKGDMGAAGLQAGLARELGLENTAGPDALDAIASGAKPELGKGHRLSLLDYRILELKGDIDQSALVGRASPGLLAVLALTPGLDPGLKLAAAEAAAAVNAIAPIDLAAIYKASGAARGSGPAFARAALYRDAESERTPLKKARAVRAFLDDARRAGLYWPALFLMAKPAQSLERVAEIGWFAETAVEASIAAGDFERARAWAAFGSKSDQSAGGLTHWIALADIADPALQMPRTANLGAVEQMALHGRFDPVVLHRLATVLDALDINVPIPLWNLASRTPQPSTGYLPDTGVLSDLADASKKQEFGRTVLLAMRTLGPAGAEGAHMIALGDAIRALKRAGLEGDARRLALEGLFTSWPRSVSN
jgi:hypothetical protein